VVEAVVADRAQEEAAEAAEAPGADHEQRCVLAGFEEGPSGQVAHHDLLDLGGGVVAEAAAYVVIESHSCVLLAVVGVEGAIWIDVVLVEVAPGQDGAEWAATCRGHERGPLQRGGAAG
jgi:hypothetical protein